MGCCLFASLLAGAPRLALLVWWLADPTRVTAVFAGWPTFGSPSFPTWAWPVAGWLLLPWVTIAYVWVAPGGITTLEWVVLAIALLFDLSAHGGGGREYVRRRSVEA